jgi:hypothetical protein
MAFYSVLNQIFYPYKKFDDPTMLESLEKWMFVPIVEVKSNIVEVPIIEVKHHIETVSIVEPVLTLDPVLKLKPEKKPREQPLFSPKKQDTLFWCSYVANYGEAEYWLIGNKYKNAELSEKQKVIEFVQKDKAAFKMAYPKLTNVKIQEIMSELMLDKKTSLQTFMALCVFYKFHAIITCKNTYLEFTPSLSNTDIPTFLFIRSDDGHFSLKQLETKADIDSIKSTHVRIESDPEKPLKAASNYKMEDLKQMAETLGIQPGEKWKKADYYESLMKRCGW